MSSDAAPRGGEPVVALIAAIAANGTLGRDG